MTTIITKNSSTAGAAPLAADLVQGELAVNVTSKALYTKNASAAVVKLNTPSIVDNGDATAITIDSSENVGIGTTPSAWGTSASTKALQVGNVSLFTQSSGGNYLQLANNAYQDSALTWKYIGTDYASNYQQFNGAHKWFNAASGTAGNTISFTQAMTLDTSGNLLVGTTSSVGTSAARVEIQNISGGRGVNIKSDSTTSANAISFNNPNGQVGYIATSGSATSYNTSSDYRLKNTIAPMSGALAKVAALKPCTYKWNADDSDGEGFIAHELAEVVPQCVTGQKDAVDADGNPVYQGIDTSFLVATLTAAIQELAAASVEQQALINAQQAALTTLTERITALEAK